ncbi:DUF2971 domain-containing protein [Stenotrophomonas sp. CCNWLW4]
MNDSMEMDWGLEALDRLIEGHAGLPQVLAEKVASVRADVKFDSMCVATCFSTKWDVLSQWRAYADNGSGFAVGFDPECLTDLPINLLEVCYSVDRQDQLIDEFLDSIEADYSRLGDADYDPGPLYEVATEEHPDDATDSDRLIARQVSKIARKVHHATYDLASFKSPAFEEESEVRLVHILKVDREAGDVVSLFSSSAEEDAWVSGRDASLGFRMKGSVPVCCLDIPLPAGAIKEIVIGPRANVSELAIRRMLSTVGHRDVTIRRSLASYR